MNINKLINLMQIKKINQRELSKLIDFSQTALSQAINRGDFKTSVIEKIAATLDVPVSYFFDELTENESKKIIGNGNNVNIVGQGNTGNNNAGNCSEYIKEIEYLKKQVDDKEEIINLLKKQITNV